MIFWRSILIGGLGLLLLAERGLADTLDPRSAARQVDELLSKERFGATEGATAELTQKTDDQTFLRRVTLDLIGHQPTPEEITSFSLDPSSEKRAAAVERLLARGEFGTNWARYWRDVILYRRSEQRALITSESVEKFLTEALNQDLPWDQIVRKFITAKGDVREEGATALIMAQSASPEDTTAEISRIFMGIQIQCAQCHHHPTDRWKREQFHELAAFFPRMAVRPLKQGEMRSFAILSVDRVREKRPNKPQQGRLEHHMPDLEHPDREGTLMTPVFFVTGQKLELGAPDQVRREKIAEWITSDDNPWFAKAFVNRMWSELAGRGFYEPVDDIGPDRKCLAPETLDELAKQFVAHHYDIKWLFRTILATDAYQRQSRSRFEEDKPRFAASCPQLLRGDQLFNALLEVLGINEPEPAPGQNNPRAIMGRPRMQMNLTFGYDPSVQRDEVAGSIPQALLLMNAPELNRAINGKQSGASLGKLLAEIPKDEALVAELYLRCLAREPKPVELRTCLDHVRTTGSRVIAFEDILWSLINSTEFLHRK